MRSYARSTISLEAAQTAIAAARRRAAELELRVTVAVVDDAGTLKALAVMDGAPPLALDIAPRKARTAAATRMTTADMFERIRGDEAERLGLPAQPGLAVWPGGVPVRGDGDEVIGAVGVSGGPAELDVEIALAAVAAIDAAAAQL